MSYHEGYIDSGQVRPERNKTAPPQVPNSDKEFWPKVIEHHLKRLLTTYRTDGMAAFRDGMAWANRLMLGVPGWGPAAEKLVLTVEQMEEQAKMEEKQGKIEKEQKEKQFMEMMMTVMQQALKPSQVTMNYPQFHAFNEITGNKKVNLRLPKNE